MEECKLLPTGSFVYLDGNFAISVAGSYLDMANRGTK